MKAYAGVDGEILMDSDREVGRPKGENKSTLSHSRGIKVELKEKTYEKMKTITI